MRVSDTETTKLCECGCGKPAPIAKQTKAKWGHVAGQPMRYVRGHAMTGRKLTPEHIKQIGDRQRGEKRPAEWGRKISAAQIGEKGPNWRGGVAHREGRRLIYVGREHPMADTYGYVYEHRLVASEALGRMLERQDYVHHRDLNPLNNAPENLVVLAPDQHTRLHNLMRDHGMTAAEAEAAGLSD